MIQIQVEINGMHTIFIYVIFVITQKEFTDYKKLGKRIIKIKQREVEIQILSN